MEIDIKSIIKHEVYNTLEKYVTEHKTGLAYVYLILNSATHDILCENNMFYGIRIAIDNNIELGKIIVVDF